MKRILSNIIARLINKNDKQELCSQTPLVILMIGINGGGKTTSIGKLAYKLKSEGKTVMLAAADTFRAAASEQLSIWADRVGINIVKHAEGADPSAVIYDAIQSAKAKNIDVLICDTAGRLQNKKNLMDELNKMNKVIGREFPEAARVNSHLKQRMKRQMKLTRRKKRVLSVLLIPHLAWTGLLPTPKTAKLPIREISQSVWMPGIRDPGWI